MTATLPGSFTSTLEPGVIVWAAGAHDDDPLLDTTRRGGLILATYWVGDVLEVQTITDGSTDDRDRQRAGLRIDRLHATEIHRCSLDGCPACPTVDTGGALARRYARRLWRRLGQSSSRHLTPSERDIALLARTLHRIAEGLTT